MTVLLSTPTAHTLPLIACLDELGRVDLAGLRGAELAEVLTGLSRAEAKIAAIRSRVLKVAEDQQTALDSGAASTGQWAARVTNADQAAAHRQVGLAHGLARRQATARALNDGYLSPEHAEIIVRTDTSLP